MTEHPLADSEQMVALIVRQLAERGVRRDELTVMDLGFELTKKSNDLFIDSITWLESEGIIRSGYNHRFHSGSEEGTVADGFTLTSYGYALLQQPFDGELTLGAAIKKVDSAGSGYSGFGDFVGGILGGFTKSVSS